MIRTPSYRNWAVRLVWTALLFYIGCASVFSQQTTVLPATHAPGDASVCYTRIWYPFSSPASLASQQQHGVQVMYENRYLTKELSNKSLNLWFITPYFNIGGAFTHFGYSSYHEMLSALTVSRSLGKRVRLGVEIDYYALFIADYNHYYGNVTAQVGLQVDVVRNFTLGLNLFNPVFSSVHSDDYTKDIPFRMQFGFCYSIEGMVDWHVEIDKTQHMPLRWATGFEYSPSSFHNIILRLGAYGYDNIMPTLGLGFEVGGVGFDIDAVYHNRLGFSLMAALRYEFKTKNMK